MSAPAKSTRRATRRLLTRPTGGTAELLLDTTAAILSERSDLEVSFRNIAKRSGLNSALIKYYFGNKEGLLVALLERDASLEMGALKRLVNLPLPADRKLCIHITGVVNAFFRSPYLNRLIHYMIGNGSARSSNLVKKIYIDPMVEAYGQIVAQGVEEGVFRQVNAKFLYFSLVGSCEYIFTSINIIAQMFKEAKITESLKQRYIDHLIELTLRGMSK